MLKDNNQDSDDDFHQKQVSFLDTSYHIPNEVKENLENLEQNSFSVLHLNNHSMSKKLWIISRIFRLIIFLIQCYLFIGNMVPTSQKFKFKSPNTWQHKAYIRLGKIAEGESFVFSYLNPSLTNQRWNDCKFQWNRMFMRWSS